MYTNDPEMIHCKRYRKRKIHYQFSIIALMKYHIDFDMYHNDSWYDYVICGKMNY